MTPTEKLIVELLSTILKNQRSRAYFDIDADVTQDALLEAAARALAQPSGLDRKFPETPVKPSSTLP